MRLKKSMAVLLAASMLSACNKENDETPTVVEGIPTYAQIEMCLAGHTQTRGTFPDGAGGTAAETAVTEVTVYVFNVVGVLEARETFTPADPTVSEKRVFKATTGVKSIYALVNILPANLPNTDLNSTTLLNFLESLKDTPALTGTHAIAEPNNFWMSNSNAETATLGEWDGTGTAPLANTVVIGVHRMVAKIGVEFNPQSQEPVGALINTTDHPVMYKIKNNPVKTRLFSKRDDGFLVTPFYDEATIIPTRYWGEADAAYKTTSVATGNVFNTTSIGYMMENSNKEPRKGNATYIVVRGKYEPAELVNAAGEAPVTTNPNADGTFYRLKNKDSGIYLPLFYHAVPTPAATDTVMTYTNGLAYYDLYINDTETAGLDPKDKYVIERNTMWSVTIVSVSGCGEPNEEELPAVKKPDDPLEVDAFLQAEIRVEDWEYRAQQGGI
ncbi:MAG: Mfa1 family fimbria major subunit [Clostridium sp.]|nr:Mfa1 family fimbria major subunit [Clostridium sp.]